MDLSFLSLYFIDRLRSGKEITLYEIIWIIIIVILGTILHALYNYFKHTNYVYEKFNALERKIYKRYYLKYKATEYNDCGELRLNMGMGFKSVNWYLSTIVKHMGLEPIKSHSSDKYVTYLINSTGQWISLNFNGQIIEFTSYTEYSDLKMKSNEPPTSVGDIKYMHLSLRSKYDILKDFVTKAEKEFEKYVASISKNKIYHFIYQGSEDNYNCIFISEQLIDYEEKESCHETLDTIFNEHSQTLKAAVTKLEDKDYYIRTKTKRKLGYLFEGLSGCGKTSTIMAIANQFKRHIIEIPMTRVKTNKQFEWIFNMKEIEDIKVKKSEMIIVFDEVDRCKFFSSLNKKKKSLKEKENKSEKNDKLNLGFMLSRLDGIGNYDGIIIIATTNDITKLDPALYRSLRLTRIHFDKSRTVDIKNMINLHFPDYQYNKKDEKDLDKFDRKFTPAHIKMLLIESMGVKDFLSKLKSTDEYTSTEGTNDLI